jgi:hypothetical protein
LHPSPNLVVRFCRIQNPDYRKSKMFTQFIWCAGVALEVLLVYRGIRSRLVWKFPLFYFYIAFVLLDDVVIFFAYRTSSVIYERVYWPTQFLALLFGCAIIFEIYRTGLRAFPGTARVARNLLLFVFAMVFAKAIVNGLNGTPWWTALTNVELERNLRIVEASAFLAVVIAFIFYSIPLGRNLKGIVVGYGAFLAVSVAELGFAALLRTRIQTVWLHLMPICYLMVLALWTAALWSCSEEPKPQHEISLEHDYRMLVAATRRRFQRSRAALGRAVRP